MEKPEPKIVEIPTIVELKVDGRPLYKIDRPFKKFIHIFSSDRRISSR
jgi:hypothetical protein